MSPGKGPRIFLYIDFGTTKIAMACAVGTTSKDQRVITLQTDTGWTVPSRFAYNPEGELLMGLELEELIKDEAEPISESDVFQHYKLSIYPDFRDLPEGRATAAHLERLAKTEHEVFTDLFNALLARVKPFVRENITWWGLKKEEITEKMETEVLLCVPQLWNNAQASVVINSLKLAGNPCIKKCQAVPEEQCALGAFDRKDFRNLQVSRYQKRL